MINLENTRHKKNQIMAIFVFTLALLYIGCKKIFKVQHICYIFNIILTVIDSQINIGY